MAAGKGACDSDRLKAFAEKQSVALAALQTFLEANKSSEALCAVPVPSNLLGDCRFNATDIANELLGAGDSDSAEVAQKISDHIHKLQELAQPHMKKLAEAVSEFLNNLWVEASAGLVSSLSSSEPMQPEWWESLKVLSSLVTYSYDFITL